MYGFPTAPNGIFMLDGNKPVAHGYGITPGLPGSDGIVGYWPLWAGASETVSNIGSRQGGDMVMETLTADSWFASEFGPALNFDGTPAANLATLDTFAQDDFDQLTLMALFRHDSPGNDKGILARGGSDITGGIGFTTRNQFRLLVKGASGQAAPSTPVSDGVWHLGVGVRENPSLHKLYLDGVLKATDTTDTGSIAPVAPIAWTIGRFGSQEYLGDIALCVAWDGALTSDEIAFQFENRFALITPPTRRVSVAVAAPVTGGRRNPLNMPLTFPIGGPL